MGKLGVNNVNQSNKISALPLYQFTSAADTYKDHKVDELLSGIEITPAVNKGGNDVALEYPVGTALHSQALMLI